MIVNMFDCYHIIMTFFMAFPQPIYIYIDTCCILMDFAAVTPSIVTPNLLLRCSTRFLSNLGQDWRLHHHQEGPWHRGGVNGHGIRGEIMGK